MSRLGRYDARPGLYGSATGSPEGLSAPARGGWRSGDCRCRRGHLRCGHLRISGAQPSPHSAADSGPRIGGAYSGWATRGGRSAFELRTMRGLPRRPRESLFRPAPAGHGPGSLLPVKAGATFKVAEQEFWAQYGVARTPPPFSQDVVGFDGKVPRPHSHLPWGDAGVSCGWMEVQAMNSRLRAEALFIAAVVAWISSAA